MICSADHGSPAVIIDWAVEAEDIVDEDHWGHCQVCLNHTWQASADQPLPFNMLTCSCVTESTGNSLAWAVGVKMVKMWNSDNIRHQNLGTRSDMTLGQS